MVTTLTINIAGQMMYIYSDPLASGLIKDCVIADGTFKIAILTFTALLLESSVVYNNTGAIISL